MFSNLSTTHIKESKLQT